MVEHSGAEVCEGFIHAPVKDWTSAPPTAEEDEKTPGSCIHSSGYTQAGLPPSMKMKRMLWLISRKQLLPGAA